MATIAAQPTIGLSSALHDALRHKHRDDLFAWELTLGRGGGRRVDAVAIPRSWSPFRVVGYEVKVDRSDWLRDDKWPEYLPHFHSFAVVCPSGVIQPEEVPEGAGLLWLAKTGTRLLTKRKPPPREVEDAHLLKLLRGLIINRATIQPDGGFGSLQLTREQRVAEWRDWLAGRESARAAGLKVRAAINRQVGEALARARDLEFENDALRYLRDRLVEAGHDPERPITRLSVGERLRAMGIDANTERLVRQRIDGALGALDRLRQALDEDRDV